MAMAPAQSQFPERQPTVSGESLVALLRFGGLACLALGGWIVADRLILSRRPAYRFPSGSTQLFQSEDINSGIELALGNGVGESSRSAIVIEPESIAPEVSEETDLSEAASALRRTLRNRLAMALVRAPQEEQTQIASQRPDVPGFGPATGGSNANQGSTSNEEGISGNVTSDNSGSASSQQRISPGGQLSQALAQGSLLGAREPAGGKVESGREARQKQRPSRPDLSALMAAPSVGARPSATTASAFDMPSTPTLPAGAIVAAVPTSETLEGSTDYLTIAARPQGWTASDPASSQPVSPTQNDTVAVQPGETVLPDLSVPDDAAQETDLDGEEQPSNIAPSAQPIEVIPSTPALQAAASARNVFVEQFTVEGSSIFSQEDLALVARKAVEPDAEDDSTIVGRELSPAELVSAGEAITQLYTDKGYLNSGAYVPADIINRQGEDNQPEIVVVEGSLEEINVEMEPPRELFGFLRGLQPGYVKQRLERIASTPLNVEELLDAVQLLERDPVIEKISTELVPGTETGTSILNVKAQPSQDLNVSLSTDNSRSPSVGSVQQRLSVSQANVLGFGDFVTFGYGRSEGTRSIDVGFSAPLNSSNGRLTASFNQSKSEVLEFPFSELDIESKSRTYEVGFRQPLKQTPEEEIALSLKATRRNSEGFFLDGATPFPSRGADLDGRTKITAVRFGQDWIRRQSKQFFSANSEFNLGLGLLGSTVSSEPPDSRFFYWRGRGQWLRQLGNDPDILFSLKGDVQLAANPLVPSEQFGLGGPATVRGYRQNSLLTDSGFLTSAEIQFPFLRLPKLSTKLKLAPFFEFGRGWNVGESSADLEQNSLAGTGLGLILEVADDFNARLDWGFPLTDINNNSGDSLHDSGVTFSVFWKAF